MHYCPEEIAIIRPPTPTSTPQKVHGDIENWRKRMFTPIPQKILPFHTEQINLFTHTHARARAHTHTHTSHQCPIPGCQWNSWMNHQDQKLPTNLRMTIPKPRQHFLGSKMAHERIKAQLSIHQSYIAYSDTFTPNISLASGKEANTHTQQSYISGVVGLRPQCVYNTHQTSGTHTHTRNCMAAPSQMLT